LTRGGDGDQGLGDGFEQQVINDGVVLIGDVGDRSRQGEDDVEIEPVPAQVLCPASLARSSVGAW
jgi:hypothetical protein